jgi:hypothetical protein
VSHAGSHGAAILERGDCNALDAGEPCPASEQLEEHDDSGEYANVDGQEDASTNKQRGNCHGRSHFIRTQNTRCAPTVPKSWTIDRKGSGFGVRGGSASSELMALNLRAKGVIEPNRAASTGIQGADRKQFNGDAPRGVSAPQRPSPRTTPTTFRLEASTPLLPTCGSRSCWGRRMLCAYCSGRLKHRSARSCRVLSFAQIRS